ncbi:MAG: DUF364 domain-containing protein [Anaerolineae bacterium]|nr:DUF364 domain-containing protein [Anaerolineae bacterium]
MSTIDVLLESVSADAPVAQVLVGAFWTAVVLDTDPPRCGLASTMHGGHLGHHLSGPPVPEAGCLLARSGRELTEWLRSESALEASIGMAAFNALLDMDEAAYTEVNAEDVILERGRGRKVAVVGHFPFVERVRQAAGECWVLELTPRPGDVPADRADELLPQADVVALTGTSLINHTFDDLIVLCRSGAFVVLLGASAPLTPVLFETGVSAISGTRVVDPQVVLRLVGQGATFRQIKRGGGVRLLTMMEGVIRDASK